MTSTISGRAMPVVAPAAETPPPLVEPRAARRRAARVVIHAIRQRLRPPPRLTVSQWANRFRILSPEACARPGPYSTDDAPYQREPMDVCGDRRFPMVVLMWGSQLGKTEILNNVAGFYIDMEPSPILVLQPTVEMAEAWSKDRLAPMLRDTPRLRDKVQAARSRDSGNTVLHKQFPGGHVTMAGANSPAGLASRPIKVLLNDEIDRYPKSAGSEGNPRSIAAARTSTFPDAKEIDTSTPTIKGDSEIEELHEQSDQRKFFLPCPHCGDEILLEWGGRDVTHGLKWDSGKPETAHYVCQACGCVIEEWQKPAMLARGRWIATNPDSKIPGFWLNALYSPYLSWEKIVKRFLLAKGDPLKLRAFVNTILAEPWEDSGESVDAHALVERLEAYPCDCSDEEQRQEGHGLACQARRVPAGVAVLIRSVDVQGDRLETAVWGFGAGEEAWLVEHEQLMGDPGTPAPWRLLEASMAKSYRHECGAVLRPAVTMIDSGGHHTKEVYGFTRTRVAQRVYAIKGASSEGAPLLSRPSRSNSAKAILYLVGSFTGKESIMARLAKIREPGPGYIHLHDGVDGEQLHQLTAEKLVTKIVGGRLKRLWLKVHQRNEFLDLFVYALAGLQVLGPHIVRQLGAMAERYAAEAKERTAAEAGAAAVPTTPPAARAAPRRGGFVNRWR